MFLDNGHRIVSSTRYARPGYYGRKKFGSEGRETRTGAPHPERERETGEERFARGWANRGNGQVAYLWQPYFGYMNWFPSKVSDVASRLFNLKMYREVSWRVRLPARFARGHLQPGVTRSLILSLPTASMDNDEPFLVQTGTKPRDIRPP